MRSFPIFYINDTPRENINWRKKLLMFVTPRAQRRGTQSNMNEGHKLYCGLNLNMPYVKSVLIYVSKLLL